MEAILNKVDRRKALVTLLMAVVGIVFLLPFAWMISASFKVEEEVLTFPIQWIPATWNAAANYQEVWTGNLPFFLYYWNSIKVSVLTTITSVTISALAAYGFAKIQFKGREALFLIVLATYMIPPQTLLVTQFLLYRWIGLYDTHTGLILLNSFSVFGTFMLRQFYMGISNEMLESAKIDGAGHFRIFWHIALPLVRPAIATYAILRFIWTWNDYQNPLIFLRSEHLYTIQLGVAAFADAHGSIYSLMMAASVSAIVPLLIVFVIGQKHVIEGIQLGGVKG
ncbi:carbohydrate ABC transporter permease [Domibacillus enclensis]|uniref:Carbohydrate ABC transporter membrane protein 2, CUT1 family n=1 Tax=Domibacillus enclensis TaxID=1017273 RepID=A0A1N6X4E8_9BACI|nr:carbohydrate ABC transporter permease [Domibacillus enclensis]OXS78110.1 sugar ABC transporter ATP-binding protein [Domibacillus enclensis]SIQ97197.1 carbohydrate ABC transporter membrane protein 2, CUT1 family [Domibacillus enclensis]